MIKMSVFYFSVITVFSIIAIFINIDFFSETLTILLFVVDSIYMYTYSNIFTNSKF